MWQRLLDIDVNYTRVLRIAEKPGPLRSLAIFFAHSGDSWFWFIGLGLLWALGTAKWQALSKAMIFSILVTALIVFTIKMLVRRQRPTGEWGEIYRKTDPHSFPSGHAARAALLVVIAAGFGPSWLYSFLFVWAPLVILARVAMGVHYLSDVLAGAVLGIITGLILSGVIPQLAFLA